MKQQESWINNWKDYLFVKKENCVQLTELIQ